MNTHRGVPLLAALAALLLAAPAASATDHPVNQCLDLQPALSAAGNGDTVTLASGLSCTGSFALPASKIGVVVSASGSGATLSGLGSAQVLQAADVFDLTLRNLTITDGHAANGGGVLITGSSEPTFDHVTFSGNTATNAGGAVDVDASGPVAFIDFTFAGNSSGGGGGGAVYLDGTGQVIVRNSTFSQNGTMSLGGAIGGFVSGAMTIDGSTFSGNNSAFGGAVGIQGPAALLFHADTFTGNSAGGDGTGGAIAAESFNGSALITDHLLVSGNSVLPGGAGSEYAGGGAAFEDYRWTGHADRFVGNSLPAPETGEDDEGAGLAIYGCLGESPVPSSADDLVVAGNSIAGAGEGAGLYVGCGLGPVDFTLSDSTISGNSTVGGGSAGIAGDTDDLLTLGNSIVAGNTGGVDIDGFATRTANHSDACAGTSALPGTANICADPKLVSAATGDARETASSPTIDHGDNSLIPGSVATDAADQPRIANGTVDIGAFEAPAPVLTPPPGGGGTTVINKLSDADLKTLLSSIVPIKLTGKLFEFVQSFPSAGSVSWTLSLGSHKLVSKKQTIKGPRLLTAKLKFGKSAQKRLKKVKTAKLKLVSNFGGVTVTKHIKIRKSRK